MFGKPYKNKWMYLPHSNEKWQHIINQSDAKLLNVNSALEKKIALSLVDRHKDIHTSQQCRQKGSGMSWKMCRLKQKWLKIDFKFCQWRWRKPPHTKKHLSQTASRKQNCAIKNIIGLSFLFVCHGGSRKLQLREELRATLLSPLQKTRRRHRPFTYSFTAFEIHLFN